MTAKTKVLTDNFSALPKAITRRYEKTTAISIWDERRRIRGAMAKPGMAAPAVHEKRSASEPREFGGMDR